MIRPFEGIRIIDATHVLAGPFAAFTFAEGGPAVTAPPPELGADTDAVLGERGYGPHEIAEFRAARIV